MYELREENSFQTLKRKAQDRPSWLEEIDTRDRPVWRQRTIDWLIWYGDNNGDEYYSEVLLVKKTKD